VPTHFTGGHYYLIARPADEERFQPAVREIELPTGEGSIVDAGVVRFLAQGGPLLRIVHADGTPAADADVTIENYSVHQSTSVDENGELFEAVTPLEGADITVSDPRCVRSPFAVHLDGVRPWTLEWADGGVRLDVVDEVGQPLTTGFTVLANGAMIPAAGAHHEVRGLSAGTHEIVIVAEGRRACVLRLNLAENELRELRVTLDPARENPRGTE